MVLLELLKLKRDWLCSDWSPMTTPVTILLDGLLLVAALVVTRFGTTEDIGPLVVAEVTTTPLLVVPLDEEEPLRSI